jgi:hypothetical protein
MNLFNLFIKVKYLKNNILENHINHKINFNFLNFHLIKIIFLE